MQTMENPGEKQNNVKINRENITKHLIEYQLNMVGKKLIDTIDDDKWFFNNTLTTEQFNQFEKYSLNLIQKVFKCNKTKAKNSFEWFNMAFGLRIKN